MPPKKNKETKGRKPFTKKNYNKNSGNQPTHLVLPFGKIMPDRLTTNLQLTFYGQTTITSAGPSAFNIRFAPTGAFDMDPLAPSTQPKGFDQLAAIYGSYRVHSSSCEIEAAQQWDSGIRLPVVMVLLPKNLDPGATPSAGNILSQIDNPYAENGIVPVAGCPPLKLRSHMSTRKLFGSDMVRYDDNFSALTNANPTNNWFWSIGTYTMGGILPPSGAPVTVHHKIIIQINIEFYDRVLV